MSKRKKINHESTHIQLAMNFDQVLKSGTTLSRDEVLGEMTGYDPIEKTAEYMRQLVESQRQWETTIQKAREGLMQSNPRELYYDFLQDLKRQIENNSTQSERLSKLLEQVAIRGLGMTPRHVQIRRPPRGSSRWKVDLDDQLIIEHLQKHVIGKYFINSVKADNSLWNDGNFLIGSSDVSQHRSDVPTNARFFHRTVPFWLNNAAGSIIRVVNGVAQYDQGKFEPQPSQKLLEWMLIDPSYQDELEPEDFNRCTATSMDIGQYIFDNDHLLSATKTAPDIVLRDGSLFPQDAYLDNCFIDNRRGEFTREAISRLRACLNSSRDFDRIYCGVAKNVRLKVYSALVDWYVSRFIDQTWNVGGYTMTDGQSMTLLLSSPDLQQDNWNTVYSTCLIRRSFTTRATLNTKTDLDNINVYFQNLLKRLTEQSDSLSNESYFQRKDPNFYKSIIKLYQNVCESFHTYIFFLSHSQQPNHLLPRYEFLDISSDKSPKDPETVVRQIWTAIKLCGFHVDSDHSFMSADPIKYMIPAITQQAHNYSKDVGKSITDVTVKQRLWNRYNELVNEMV